jgi:hypothetical protein
MRSVFILQYSLKSIIIMLTFGKIIQRFIDAIDSGVTFYAIDEIVPSGLLKNR